VMHSISMTTRPAAHSDGRAKCGREASRGREFGAERASGGHAGGGAGKVGGLPQPAAGATMGSHLGGCC
jgi:hypothetical protein